MNQIGVRALFCLHQCFCIQCIEQMQSRSFYLYLFIIVKNRTCWPKLQHTNSVGPCYEKDPWSIIHFLVPPTWALSEFSTRGEICHETLEISLNTALRGSKLSKHFAPFGYL